MSENKNVEKTLAEKLAEFLLANKNLDVLISYDPWQGPEGCVEYISVCREEEYDTDNGIGVRLVECSADHPDATIVLSVKPPVAEGE